MDYSQVVRAAAVQISPVLHSREGTTEKVLDAIAAAAKESLLKLRLNQAPWSLLETVSPEQDRDPVVSPASPPQAAETELSL